MKEIPVPEVEWTDDTREDVAIEEAFNTLISKAQTLGLPVRPVMGLMYLPTEELTADFKKACRAILEALKL